MKNSLKIILNKVSGLFFGLVALGVIYGCVEELPGPGSMPDENPPVASFSYASQENFLEIKFTNLSAEALSYEWDFAEGVEVPDSVLTAIDPTYTYAKVGTYEVTLTAVDGLGVVSDTTISVVVEEGPYQPVILEPGFEGDGETGDARDPWEAEWSSQIQISSSPVASGDQAGKLPSDGERAAYQEFVVEAESNYDVSFIYTLTNAVPGSLTVEILDVTANEGTFMTYEDTRDYVIGSVTLNDQEDPETYVGGEVSFATGESTKVAIMVTNSAGCDARFDNFAIQIGNAGAVPPSASFEAVQSDDNYLEYTFTNGSLNGATYFWDFGDGNTSTDESPVHEYEEADTYTVSLTTTSEGGLTGSFSLEFVIHDPVTAGFDYIVDGFTVHLNDTSINAVSLKWEFGDGFGASIEEPSHTYSEAGFYNISLVATSSTGLESEASVTLALGLPAVENGDFEDNCAGCGKDSWRPDDGFSNGDGNGDPYSGSGDGAFQTYDGTATEESTRGAKIDGSRCAVDALGDHDGSNTRYAYQSMTLDPNTEYYLEFSYDNADGTFVAGEILDGHFTDGSAALAASLDGSSLVEIQGTVSNGEDIGNDWRTIRAKFTSNATGEVAIWMWAFGGKSYYDNIKILPAWLVEAED